jgi:hypothetical protein
MACGGQSELHMTCVHCRERYGLLVMCKAPGKTPAHLFDVFTLAPGTAAHSNAAASHMRHAHLPSCNS